MLGRLVVVCLLVPAVASAYSDHTLYDAPVGEGGAGGRYFTGARVDGYTCDVCHRGGTTDEFTVDPLPSHLEAGRRYDVVVRWTDPEAPHALHVEISGVGGMNPAWMLPATVARESHCNLDPMKPSALYTVAAGVRSVLGVDTCGAQVFTGSFVATVGTLELSIAGVRGNSSDSADDDLTFERRITFNVPAEATGCAASSGGGLGVGLGLVLGLLVRTRRRRAP